MVHAAGAQQWVAHADGDAGAQQRVNNNRQLTCRDFADVEADPIPVWQAGMRRNQPWPGIGHISSDSQAMDSTAMICRPWHETP